MRYFRSLVALGVIAGIQLCYGQKDPLEDFCRRFGHSTAIVDRKLYIDGGLLNWDPIELNPLNYTNTWLLYADLEIAREGMPAQYANLSKDSTVPSVHGGILWPDTVNKYLYLYGGEYYQSSPESFTLWSYDIVNNNWQASSSGATQIQRVSYGAGVAVQDTGTGYYYGGWLSNATVPGWGGPPLATSNLIIYDMLEDSWRNTTGPDSIPRAEGVMLYLPVSDGGMLVYFGGIETPYGPGNNTAIGVPMNQIMLYDIANDKWYTQNATGDVPEMRRRFCAGVTWAEDRSSYNIYLYGGASMPPLTVGFDDVYILTIPSFTWIKWYPTTPGASYPHHSLSCDVIENSQMIVMGGTFPNSTACDNPDGYAQHNLQLGKQNEEDAKWYAYEPELSEYKVPSEIIATIGGGADGGATLLAPTQGWDDRDLPVYFTRLYSPEARTPTRSLPATATTAPTSSPTQASESSNIGAIVGGAVGGGVFAIICIIGLCLLFLRRRKIKRQSQNAATITAVSELPNKPHSTMSPGSTHVQQSGSTSPAPDARGYPLYSNSPRNSPPYGTPHAQSSSPAPQSYSPPGPPLHPGQASQEYFPSPQMPSPYALSQLWAHQPQPTFSAPQPHYTGLPMTSIHELSGTRSPPVGDYPFHQPNPMAGMGSNPFLINVHGSKQEGHLHSHSPPFPDHHESAAAAAAVPRAPVPQSPHTPQISQWSPGTPQAEPSPYGGSSVAPTLVSAGNDQQQPSPKPERLPAMPQVDDQQVSNSASKGELRRSRSART